MGFPYLHSETTRKSTALLRLSSKKAVFYGIGMPRKPAPYYAYCLRLAALYLPVLFHYKNGALFHTVRQMKNGRDEAV